MPVKKGHAAPQNVFIESIIKRFDRPNCSFMVSNAVGDCNTIFVNENFCRMTGFSRADVMRKPCTCDYLHGQLTSNTSIQTFRDALSSCEEKTLEVLFYKKDGTKFLCKTTICPIKNEAGDTCMFLVSFEDMAAQPAPAEQSHTMQSKFNRARASFRQSFRMVPGGVSRRRGERKWAAKSLGSSGSRQHMIPIPDHPEQEGRTSQGSFRSSSSQDVFNESKITEISATPSPCKRSVTPGDSEEDVLESLNLESLGNNDWKDPRVQNSMSKRRKINRKQTLKEEADTFFPVEEVCGSLRGSFGRSSSDDVIETTSIDDRRRLSVLFQSAYGHPLSEYLKTHGSSVSVPRKCSLPTWGRKDSTSSTHGSLTNTISHITVPRLGSIFGTTETHSHISLRGASSLDAISHHRVSIPIGGKETPLPSKVLNQTYKNEILENYQNARSDSDLTRSRIKPLTRERKSPSLSNITTDGTKYKFSLQEPNGTKAIFPNSKAHQKIDKVAHVGQVALSFVITSMDTTYE